MGKTVHDITEQSAYKPFGPWVALQHNDHKDDGYWSIAPKPFWDAFGKIPDWSVGDMIESFSGWWECMDHTLETSVNNPRQSLIEAGFEIVDDPTWWFDR